MTIPSNVIPMKKAPVGKRSRMDTVEITPRMLHAWMIPPFQRPLRVNDKVRMIAELIKDNGGVVPGVITVGVLQKGPQAGTYIIDGQHRMHALEMANLPNAYADVRIVEFDTLAEMGQEFVDLNSAIVKMRPDDVLRGIEDSLPTLTAIRAKCPFVGYDNIRRNNHSPIVSMSMMIRLWTGSMPDAPISGSGSALSLAQSLTTDEAASLCDLLNIALASWGREAAAQRLWSGLNLGLCMWLYRRLVLDKDRLGKKRFMLLKAGQFQKCLMSLAANELYIDWLLGRHLSDRDRPGAYSKIKAIFNSRLKAESFDAPIRYPQPAWASNT